MEIKLKMPQELKAKVMLWTDISHDDMEKLNQISSVPDLQIALCEVLNIDLPEPKTGILLDLYVQAMFFCRNNHFKTEQTSTLLSIIKCIHEANTETPLNNIVQCHSYCKELLLCHSVHRPPFSLDLYNSEEVTSIYNYIYNNYMRHYRLYKFVFTQQVKLDLSVTYTGSENDVTSASTENNLTNSSLEKNDSLSE